MTARAQFGTIPSAMVDRYLNAVTVIVLAAAITLTVVFPSWMGPIGGTLGLFAVIMATIRIRLSRR